ncbi:RNA pyrophosphohydrolase [uncultured archaeon]|nr:RNA pyrophosphohydrolase [uncultured archaeon]
MKIKKCAGAIIYNSEGKIFLMTSPKWKGYIIPGGKIENNETDTEALKREINEELQIEITDIKKIDESIKMPSNDFKDPDTKFHFVSFSARALQTKITPNEEILEYGWYTIKEALELPLVDSTKSLLKKYIELKINNS